MNVVFHEDFYRCYVHDAAAVEGRMEAIVDAIAPAVTFVDAEPAEASWIRRVHTDDQIQRVQRLGLYPIAALAAGGAAQAARLGLSAPAFGLIRPPGHHASAGSCWGYCYFNNMAVALGALHAEGRIASAAVIDIDLHYGDGTVDILGQRPWATVHNPNAYSREEFLREVELCLDGPSVDIIGISAGFDRHRRDWGGQLESDDYAVIGRMVTAAAQRRGAGCFALLEGGYNQSVLGRNVAALLAGLCG